jgi:hypothetical protein
LQNGKIGVKKNLQKELQNETRLEQFATTF